MCTAVEETNIEAILAVMNTTASAVEIRPEKNQSNSGQFKKFNSTTSSVVFTSDCEDRFCIQKWCGHCC